MLYQECIQNKFFIRCCEIISPVFLSFYSRNFLYHHPFLALSPPTWYTAVYRHRLRERDVFSLSVARYFPAKLSHVTLYTLPDWLAPGHVSRYSSSYWSESGHQAPGQCWEDSSSHC